MTVIFSNGLEKAALPVSRYILSKSKHLHNKEIAELLKISEKTVESQLNKASKFMRESLLPYTDKLNI